MPKDDMPKELSSAQLKTIPHMLAARTFEDAAEQFGQAHMPILQELGVDPGQPMISPAHNIIKG